MSTKAILAAIGLALLTLLPAASAGDDDLAVLPREIGGAAPSEALHGWLMDRVREATDRHDAAYEKVKTPEEIEAYQKRMRDFFIKQLGGFPDRTPLNAQVVGREERDGYRIEKIIFESQPKHFVTAILYLPEAKPPYPGVLVPCGHSANGKARDLYQRAPILIAKSGMAALCYDPMDQGERHQLLDSSGKPLVAGSTTGHALVGVGAVLLGRNTATYRVWDGIRAIDYLASRPEVDPQRIGCTGISGGGTLTSYLMALDDRVQAAAPGCYLTSFRRLLETIGPQDAEQTIYGQIAFGLDHADYVLIRAPKPTLMMTATGDYFDIDGAWHSFRQAKRWYGHLDHAERMDLVEVAGGHDFAAPMREAAARWMRRWLLGIDDAIIEKEFPVVADEALRCTPRGEVMLLEGARSVYDLNAELEEKLAAERKSFWQTSGKAKALDEVRRITGIRRLSELPQPKWDKRGEVRREGYRIEKIVLRPEGALPLAALLLVPDRPASAATIYLQAEGKQKDAGPGGPLEQLAHRGQIVLAPDLCGIGETAPSGKHSYAAFLPPEWRESTIAYLLGKSLLAMRCEEILLCARFLAGYGGPAAPRPVHLVSVGRVGPPALHAAALEPELFATVTLRNSLISWSNVVHTPLSKNQFVNLVHGALERYDLPDLATSLPAEKMKLIDPLDAAEKQR